MKRIFYGIIFLTFSLSMLQAQQADSLFSQANRLYAQKKYAEALDVYRRIPETGKVSAELYYNMGNAAYKLNKKALSVLYYKKALNMRPGYAAAKHNLTLLRRSLTDRIEPAPLAFHIKLWKKWTGMLSVGVWAILSRLWAWLLLAAVLFYLYSQKPARKRWAFALAGISAGIWMLTWISYRSAKAEHEKTEAVVAVPETRWRARIDTDTSRTGILHEGTVVQILDSSGNWYRVQTADGNRFWLPGSDILKINERY